MITPQRLLFQPIKVITRKTRHEDHGNGDHKCADDDDKDAVASTKGIFAQCKGSHAVDEQGDEGGGDGDDHAVTQIGPEIKAFERISVILPRQADLTDLFPLVNVDFDQVTRGGRVDQLRLNADAAHLRQLLDRAIVEGNIEERQRFVIALRPSPSAVSRAEIGAGIRRVRPVF